MVRQTSHERGEKFRFRKVKPEADRLRSEIQAWAQRCKKRAVELYDGAEVNLTYLVHLRDRTADIVEPLAAILEAAYEGKMDVQDRRMALLEAVHLTRKDGEEFLSLRRILRELTKIAAIQDPIIGNASELAELCALDPEPTEYEVSGALRSYNFESRSIRLGNSVRKRYELSHAQLADICARLL